MTDSKKITEERVMALINDLYNEKDYKEVNSKNFNLSSVKNLQQKFADYFCIYDNVKNKVPYSYLAKNFYQPKDKINISITKKISRNKIYAYMGKMEELFENKNFIKLKL